MSTDSQADAIKAVLSGATKVQALDLDEIQRLGALPAKYVEVHLSRRYGGNVRGDSQENHLRRLQTRAVASTVPDARLIEDRIADVFAHTAHDLGGDVRATFNYESGGGTFDHDAASDRYHALTDWTFSV